MERPAFRFFPRLLQAERFFSFCPKPVFGNICTEIYGAHPWVMLWLGYAMPTALPAIKQKENVSADLPRHYGFLSLSLFMGDLERKGVANTLVLSGGSFCFALFLFVLQSYSRL
jgi:hypothetical protein